MRFNTDKKRLHDRNMIGFYTKRTIARTIIKGMQQYSDYRENQFYSVPTLTPPPSLPNRSNPKSQPDPTP